MQATEFEIETFGEFEQQFQTPGSERGTLFVVVEHLDGQLLEDVEVVTVTPRQSGSSPDQDVFSMAVEPLPKEEPAATVELETTVTGVIQAFAGELPAEATNLRVRIGGGRSRRVRIFVGWVKGFWPRTACAQCRAIVKAVLRVAQAAGGEFGVTELAEAIVNFIAETLGEGALDILRDVANTLGALDRARDRIAEKVCRKLGYCP